MGKPHSLGKKRNNIIVQLFSGGRRKKEKCDGLAQNSVQPSAPCLSSVCPEMALSPDLGVMLKK
jgi:hypothetical protein